MSEAPKKAIPRPALPEDFEELTRTLFAEIWEVPLAALHGGRGQRQYGVDVLADSPRGRFGIQCKLHDESAQVSAGQLSSELTAEIEKARGFQPPLARFVFATTSRRRGEVQRLAAEINERHRKEGLFEVTAFFWEDFEEHLRLYPDVLQPYTEQARPRRWVEAHPQDAARSGRSRDRTSGCADLVPRASPGGKGKQKVNGLRMRT